MVLSRRGFLWGIAAGAATLSLPARASIARAIGLSELVARSRHVLVGTAVDAQCQWELIGKRKRIVTYSLVRVEAALDGVAPESDEVLVRTLGGSIGDLGQVVHGEAMLALGERSAVFLADATPGVFRVTAMSQGHYPIRMDPVGVHRLRAGVSSMELLGAEDAAVRRLDGRTVTEAQTLLAGELSRARR